MAPGSNDSSENVVLPTKLVQAQNQSVEKSDDKSKTPRHPRWTRQETLTLIEGKKIAENRGRKGRKSSSVFGSEQLEPKWDAVSSHCRERGVNRGPVQCRKRWSNLVSDFKKIKTWESGVNEDKDSFWVMRSDLRRERKLPGFFDREIYDVLDGKAFNTAVYQLALVTISADETNGEGLDVEAEEEDEMVEDEEAEPEDVRSSDVDQTAKDETKTSPVKEKIKKDGDTKIHSPVPISEIRYPPFYQAYSTQGNAGTTNGKRQGSAFQDGVEFQDGVKRRRQSSDESQNVNVKEQLIGLLQRNTDLLKGQLEAQKLNFELERKYREDCRDSLITALNKITDVLGKIAEKMQMQVASQ